MPESTSTGAEPTRVTCAAPSMTYVAPTHGPEAGVDFMVRSNEVNQYRETANPSVTISSPNIMVDSTMFAALQQRLSSH